MDLFGAIIGYSIYDSLLGDESTSHKRDDGYYTRPGRTMTDAERAEAEQKSRDILESFRQHTHHMQSTYFTSKLDSEVSITTTKNPPSKSEYRTLSYNTINGYYQTQHHSFVQVKDGNLWRFVPRKKSIKEGLLIQDLPTNIRNKKLLFSKDNSMMDQLLQVISPTFHTSKKYDAEIYNRHGFHTSLLPPDHAFIENNYLDIRHYLSSKK